MPTVLVGTEDGIQTPDDGRAARLPGRAVEALTAADGALWALADGREVWRYDGDGEGRAAASSPGPRLRCLAVAGGTVLAGTAEAHLLRLDAGDLRPVEPFDRVAGRDGWYTPWGGPPDVRSVAVGPDGALWVNVHVGGIPTSPDGGRTWRPTIDVDADVHQVLAHPDDPRRVLAATARGLADSADAGASWTYLTEGMHARYCRAVALAGDTVVVSCSTGPRGGRATLYRRPLDAPADTPFQRCRDGLPEWFPANIDTACVDASGPTVAFGTAAGEAFASADAGVSWERVAVGLPPVRCLLLLD
jgi:PQQ-like domain